MTIKPRRYYWTVLLAFLVACGKQTATLPTETPVPTVDSPTPLPTSTLIPVTVTPSPLPTQPIISMITPDSIQVERWEEYEDALALALFKSSFIPGEFLCEWEIIGRSDQEVYVWTVCMSTFAVGNNGLHYNAGMPAVIHVDMTGNIQSVEIPGVGNQYAADILQMFPPDAQDKYFGRLIHFQELTDHLTWRLTHPEEPPLIVLSGMPPKTPVIPTPSPLPTQPIIPVITPDSIQVEKWKEYEDALVQGILPTFSSESILCEWDILARSGQEVYVWAVCASPNVSDWRPAVIHLGVDGSFQSVEIPKRGSSSEIDTMFPEEAQMKFSFYTGNSLFDGRLKEMLQHLRYRETHPEEPPLIVLSATPTP